MQNLRQVSLYCSCGGTQFSTNEIDTKVKCISCDRILEKEELISENAESIHAHKNEIVNEFLNKFKADFKKSFQGNKFVKIR